jgi:hypothetical protein
MPSKIGRIDGNNNFVPEAGLNLVVASGAAIRLDGFVRLHVANLNWVVVAKVHDGPLREQCPHDECGRHQDGSAQEHVVRAATDRFSIGVVAHRPHGTTSC